MEEIEGYSDTAHPVTLMVEVLKKRGWQGKRVALDRNAWFFTVTSREARRRVGELLDGSMLVNRCGK